MIYQHVFSGNSFSDIVTEQKKVDFTGYKKKQKKTDKQKLKRYLVFQISHRNILVYPKTSFTNHHCLPQKYTYALKLFKSALFVLTSKYA